MNYCDSLTKYNRRKTNTVNIGDIPIGSDFPIRIQSMTTSNTLDTDLTVKQSIRMIEAGSDYVRITAPGRKEAENLKNIKNKLRSMGYETPLIADIHFTPNAALIAARLVEKVRINPGNYVDSKKFNYIDYSDLEYSNEIEKIRTRFVPLIKVCKEYGTAIRVGTNHGSLSDRILSRYGDTPLGMVESALEFLRICMDENYHDVILSMKSSNPLVMVQAYRLLVNRMEKENMYYPLHLGVTEAGEGEDGRIKSSVGIGTLLEDGLGDTIRVSLTEEPEFEIPVAKTLVKRYDDRMNHSNILEINNNPINPFEYKIFPTNQVYNVGGDNVPRVLIDLSYLSEINNDIIETLGYKYIKESDKWEISDMASDYIYIAKTQININVPGTLGVIQNYSNWQKDKKFCYPLISKDEYLNEKNDIHPKLNFLNIELLYITDEIITMIKDDPTIVLIIYTNNINGLAEQRRLCIKLINSKCYAPIIINRKYNELSIEDLQLYSATDLGGLLVDGLGDGIFLKVRGFENLEDINKTAFGILQATRTRITKTEFISCPSCGRTLFDLQEVTARIRLKTQHLKGLKIGIMGCIVNGPGEMADADYGYVGTGIGKISLYKKQEVINRDVPMQEADEALINLIKDNGDWIDP